MRDDNVHGNPEENHLQDDESSSEDISTENDSNLETTENGDGDSVDQRDNAIEETVQSRLTGWRTNDPVNDEVDNFDEVDNIDEVDTNIVNYSNSETNNENVDSISGDLGNMSIDEVDQWLRSRITNWSTNDQVDNNDEVDTNDVNDESENNSEDVSPDLVDTNLYHYEVDNKIHTYHMDGMNSYLDDFLQREALASNNDEVDNSDVNDESGNISDDQANTYDANDDEVDNSDVNDDVVNNSDDVASIDVNVGFGNNSDDDDYVDNSDVNVESDNNNDDFGLDQVNVVNTDYFNDHEVGNIDEVDNIDVVDNNDDVQNDTNARYRKWNEAFTKYFL